MYTEKMRRTFYDFGKCKQNKSVLSKKSIKVQKRAETAWKGRKLQNPICEHTLALNWHAFLFCVAHG